MNAATRLGFIGIGLMGRPMALRLLDAGQRLTAWNRTHDKLAPLLARGAVAAASPAEVAQAAEVVMICVTDQRAVEQVLFGPDGVAAGGSPGKLVVDFSSIAPAAARDYAARLEAGCGMGLVDAPVSGGVPGAEKGTLAIMAGGDPDAVERIRPILQAMGSKIFHTGPLGSGHAMKALNNYVSASGLVAACEALVVGKEFGLDPGTIVDVLNESTGRNNSTETKLKPFVLAESFSSGFSIGLMAKDIRTAAALASEIGASAPEIEAAAELWEEAAGIIGKGSDHTEIYRFLANRKMH